MTKMNKKVLSTVMLILIVFTLTLTGCGSDSSLKGAVADKTFTNQQLKDFATITKNFNGDDFDYTKENAQSYDKWLSYMTNSLKNNMKKTIESRVKADKANETVETFDKVQIKSIKKLIKNKKTYAVVNFDVYENIKHSKDKTKNGKKVKINGNIYLTKVGSDYKVDNFDYGVANIVK
jgi:predicted small lipoprotein YifL